MSALNDFLRMVVDDCVNARWYPEDIGLCDACGSEVGERRRGRHNGDPAWLCEGCEDS